jgi:hypothetical protein
MLIVWGAQPPRLLFAAPSRQTLWQTNRTWGEPDETDVPAAVPGPSQLRDTSTRDGYIAGVVDFVNRKS